MGRISFTLSVEVLRPKLGEDVSFPLYLQLETRSRQDHLCVIFLKPGMILWMRPATERRRFIVTSSLIDWVHTQNHLCKPIK